MNDLILVNLTDSECIDKISKNELDDVIRKYLLKVLKDGVYHLKNKRRIDLTDPKELFSLNTRDSSICYGYIDPKAPSEYHVLHYLFFNRIQDIYDQILIEFKNTTIINSKDMDFQFRISTPTKAKLNILCKTYDISYADLLERLIDAEYHKWNWNL